MDYQYAAYQTQQELKAAARAISEAADISHFPHQVENSALNALRAMDTAGTMQSETKKIIAASFSLVINGTITGSANSQKRAARVQSTLTLNIMLNTAENNPNPHTTMLKSTFYSLYHWLDKYEDEYANPERWYPVGQSDMYFGDLLSTVFHFTDPHKFMHIIES